MTTLNAAYKAVEREIIERIEAIVPVEQRAFRFRHYTDANNAARKIENYTGRPRVFRLGPAMRTENIASCAGSNRSKWVAPLAIVYPVDNFEGANWSAIAADDFNQIRADLLNNSTTLSGVAYRMIKVDATPTFVKYTDDPWHLMTADVEFYFDVTTS